MFSLRVLHGFSQKSNDDEFSHKSNGGRIFLGIKQGFCKEKTQGTKKMQFFWFSLGVLHGFSQKSNDDEFFWKLNGGRRPLEQIQKT